jgi:PAS domain S-box-containing protein
LTSFTVRALSAALLGAHPWLMVALGAAIHRSGRRRGRVALADTPSAVPTHGTAQVASGGGETGGDRLVHVLEAERVRFQAVLRHMPFAVIVAEPPDGRIVFSNEEAERIFGAPLRQPASIGQYAQSSAFHENGQPYQSDEYPIVRALAGEVVGGEEMEVVRHDGTRCPVLVSARPVFDDAGRIVAAVGTFHDISDTKKAERERDDLARHQHTARIDAEAAHTRLALLAEISQFLLASLDYQAAISGLTRLVLPSLGDGCFIDLEEPGQAHRVVIAHISPQKASLLQTLDARGGLTEMVGAALPTALRTVRPERGDLVAEARSARPAGNDDRQALVRAIDPRAYMVIPLVTRGRVLGAMVFLVTESHRHYSVDDLDFAQHVARRAATAVDNLRLYEEARQAKLAAEDANRLKDEFLATLSHELRTPLNAILGWARMLRARALDPPTEDKALATIERNALAQARIIEDLLDVSRVITGRLHLDLQPIDFGNLIDAAITAIRPAAMAKGIQVESHVDRVESMVGDPGRLQQVIWNLVSNATKFTPPGGRIDVRVEQREGEVKVSVSDTGAGISPHFLPNVFERFRQADSTTTRTHGGLGLGLAIVRHLVELHGGTIEAESPGLDQGSTFIVRLPIRQGTLGPASTVPAGSAERSVGVEPLQDLAGIPVLVVDDEPDARDLFASILRQHGAIVRTAASTHDALEMFTDFAPRVLVADIAMPGEDGYSLIRQVRRGHADVPAVALTAHVRPEDRWRAFDAGFAMHLAKPVEPDDLVGAVVDLSRRPPGRSSR